MDEPLAALDAQRKTEVLPYLERLHSALDIPVVYVSHALDEVARLAEHMVLLEAGRVRASGPTAELIARLDLPPGPGRCGGHGGHRHRDRTCTAGSHHLRSIRGDSCCWSAPARAAGDTVKLRVQARDVSLALTPPQDSSILNIVPATVAEMREDSPGQWMVALQAGPTRLLARVTQRSVHALQLRPGLHVFAQIKGIAIVN